MKPGPVRMSGVLTTWNDERGFGFVAPAVGGPDVFVHISAFGPDDPRPARGDEIGYELEYSPEGKPRAGRASVLALVGDRPSPEPPPLAKLVPTRRASRLGYLAIVGFVGIAFVVALIRPIPFWVWVLYLGMSFATFVAYALDKRAAASEGWRLSEGSLLALGLACGWPGAIVAQQVVRHKTVKMSFQVVFWITVVVNVVAFVVFSWVATLATPDAAPALPLLP
ncbi:cold shock and DUF1294 domain-containing protein [Protaetiibacter sp. SSC-01]|uniref:DUF1294 domain-containing protein n=1 Tax=Protaetiibacter sp. SSC-01 TaxID=2759943 RepID=UPI001CA44377|nr:cold shock and DUF1294 domain-containing protein [Protaetiibacter sp. SSC-01]